MLIKAIYLTDELEVSDYDYLKQIDLEKYQIVLLCNKSDKMALDKLRPFIEANAFFDDYLGICDYLSNHSVDYIITPHNHLALLALRLGKKAISICRHLVKLTEGGTLERIVMENYVLREASEVVYSSEELRNEACKRYRMREEGKGKVPLQKLKQNLILFGAGDYGEYSYRRFRKDHTIVAFADNNPKLKGREKNGIPVIGGEEIRRFDLDETDIIICMKSYKAVSDQIRNMGIKVFYIMLDGFLFLCDEKDSIIPIEINQYPYYHKQPNEKNILYVQDAACIRTHKTAKAMHKAGYHVNLLYMSAPPDDGNVTFAENYDHTWGFTSLEGVVDFIQNSDFDVIHCSNEPDILANICLLTGKPVVFDAHDMMSIRGDISKENMVFEYCANKLSNGCIYTSSGIQEIVQKKFSIDEFKCMTLENLVFDQETINCSYEKVSLSDGNIHCVYEGGIEAENREHHRYFETIWEKIASNGVHIHFYSQANLQYCKRLEAIHPNIHYEGNLGTDRLITEMTKYDCGLAIFNVTERNRTFLETSSPNKISEYLNTGIPVMVGGVKSHERFVDQYHVGMALDLNRDIEWQFRKILEIKISPNFLTENKFTVMSHLQDLSAFYEKVIDSKTSDKL